MTEEVKNTILKKGIKSIPKFIWVMCASYALIMATNVFVLKFSDIDADKHINRYFDIMLSERESQKECKADNHKEIINRLKQLEQYSHKPKQ